MADEDITLNEDQLLESLDETNGEQETEIVTETEVSCERQKNQFHFALNAKAQRNSRKKALAKLPKQSGSHFRSVISIHTESRQKHSAF